VEHTLTGVPAAPTICYPEVCNLLWASWETGGVVSNIISMTRITGEYSLFVEVNTTDRNQ